MKYILILILACVAPIMGSLAVVDYSEENLGGKIKFKIENLGTDAIDITGYSIMIFGTGSIFPDEIKQQPQSGTSGVSFIGSQDCGNNQYVFTAEAAGNMTIPVGSCWFGTTFHCDQTLEFWLGENAEIEMDHFGSTGVVILDDVDNVIWGQIPDGFEDCAYITTPSSSSSSTTDCTIDMYDTIITRIDSFYNVGVPVDSVYTVPVPVDSFYNVGVPVDSVYTVPVPVDSFYNVGVPVDSVYNVPVPVDSFYTVFIPRDSIVTRELILYDTIWSTVATEQEAEYELVINGDIIQSSTVYQDDFETSPILKVSVNMQNINPGDEVILNYVVAVYDAIGQYVDTVDGFEVLESDGGFIIDSYEYKLFRTNNRGEIVSNANRRYGNGVYILRAVVKMVVNSDEVQREKIETNIGYRR